MTITNSFILLWQCPDQPGIVATVTQFFFQKIGNIIHLEQYVDDNNILFMRLEAEYNTSEEYQILESGLNNIAQDFQAIYEFKNLNAKPKVALFVSKHLHCLYDILWRHKLGELSCAFSVIISNHMEAKDIADDFGIEYIYLPINKDKSNKQDVEAQQIQILKQYNIDLIVLARYMQILSSEFINEFKHQIINIHHSFLPAFMGGDPYRQALQRGVKIIGATSHYATEDLDEGPIIEQDIIRISHQDSLTDLKAKGRDLEKVVLARAIKAHLEYRIIVQDRRTIIFKK